MNLRKRLGALLLSGAMLLTMAPSMMRASAASTGTIVLTINSPNMIVNGTSKAIDTEGSKPSLDAGGYTMLPLRGVVEAMGGNLTWDAATRTITMVKDNQNVQLKVGSTTATVNGVQQNMLANNGVYKAPYLNSAGRTLVHVRALQLFTSTTCTWNQATQQVTVSYPDNTQVTPPVTSKNYRVDIINKSGASIDKLYYAQAGTYAYGKNVLTSTVPNNGKTSFYLSIPDNATVRVYDFYTEGSGGTKYFQGLNFTGVNAYVTVVLRENGKMEQANDKTITIGETALKLVNDSSRAIEELYMSKSSNFSSSENMLASQTVKAGASTTLNIDLDNTKTWYFKAVTDDGKEYSNSVSFSSTTTKNETLTFTSGKRLSLKGSGDTVLTFENKSNDTIQEIYLATSKSKLDDADDLLDSELDDDDTLDIDFDLESEKNWYIRVVFDSNDDLKQESLTFSYKDPASATIRINKSSAEVRNEKRSAGDGDLTIAIINDTTRDIEEAYLVEDRKDFDRDDEDDILDGDELARNEYVVLTDIASTEKYDLILYYGSGDDDWDYFSVDFSDADDYAAVHVNSSGNESFDGDVYDDNDDEVILGIYNDSGSNLDGLELMENASGSKTIKSIGTLSHDTYAYVVMDAYDYPDVKLIWTGYNDSVELDDMDDEYAFSLVTLNNTSGNFDFESIDDL